MTQIKSFTIPYVLARSMGSIVDSYVIEDGVERLAWFVVAGFITVHGGSAQVRYRRING